MGKRRYFLKRGRKYRKSYWMSLFESMKMSCTIGVYNGIPLFVRSKAIIGNEDKDLIGILPDVISEAKKNMNSGYFKSACLTEPNALISSTDWIANPKLLTMMMKFLVRYYVPTRLHYIAWEQSGQVDTTPEKNIISAYFDLINPSTETSAQRRIAKCVAIINEIFTGALPLSGGNENAMFYPINKLVGFKISHLLRRCGVVALLYPYPLEPTDIQSARASAQAVAFETGRFVNVDTSGLKRLSSKVSNKGDVDNLADKGNPYNAAGIRVDAIENLNNSDQQ